MALVAQAKRVEERIVCDGKRPCDDQERRAEHGAHVARPLSCGLGHVGHEAAQPVLADDAERDGLRQACRRTRQACGQRRSPSAASRPSRSSGAVALVLGVDRATKG